MTATKKSNPKTKSILKSKTKSVSKKTIPNKKVKLAEDAPARSEKKITTNKKNVLAKPKKVATKKSSSTKKISSSKKATSSVLKKNGLEKKTKALKKNKTLVENTATTLLRSTILEAIKDIKGEKIISIDLRHLDEAIADYFIICEATTFIQLKGIIDNIEKKAKEICNEKVFRRNVESQSAWLILDYIDIVVHLFLPEQRGFYNLEEYWNDGIIEKIKG